MSPMTMKEIKSAATDSQREKISRYAEGGSVPGWVETAAKWANMPNVWIDRALGVPTLTERVGKVIGESGPLADDVPARSADDTGPE